MCAYVYRTDDELVCFFRRRARFENTAAQSKSQAVPRDLIFKNPRPCSALKDLRLSIRRSRTERVGGDRSNRDCVESYRAIVDRWLRRPRAPRVRGNIMTCKRLMRLTGVCRHRTRYHLFVSAPSSRCSRSVDRLRPNGSRASFRLP